MHRSQNARPTVRAVNETLEPRTRPAGSAPNPARDTPRPSGDPGQTMTAAAGGKMRHELPPAPRVVVWACRPALRLPAPLSPPARALAPTRSSASRWARPAAHQPRRLAADTLASRDAQARAQPRRSGGAGTTRTRPSAPAAKGERREATSMSGARLSACAAWCRSCRSGSLSGACAAGAARWR